MWFECALTPLRTPLGVLSPLWMRVGSGEVVEVIWGHQGGVIKIGPGDFLEERILVTLCEALGLCQQGGHY